MKNKFEIDYEYYDKNKLMEYWKQYPIEPIPYIECTTAKIGFKVNNKLIPPEESEKTKGEQTVIEPLSDLCGNISQTVILLKENKIETFYFGDRPLEISLLLNKNKIEIQFKGAVDYNLKMEYEDFLNSVLSLLDNFIKDIESTNMLLLEIDHYRAIKKNREKIQLMKESLQKGEEK